MTFDKTCKFFNMIEEFIEYGTHTPENDDYEEESIELDDAKFVELVRSMYGGRFKPDGVDVAWRRVVFGCDILIDNCCNPDEGHLAFKPEIRKLLEPTGEDKAELSDLLSNDIRKVDGKHDLGASELASKLVELGWKRSN